MELKAGARLRSVTDSTEVVVVRAPASAADLRCGGQPMVALGADTPAGGAVDANFAEGPQVGKRYADEETGLEVLCTKAGERSLSLGPQPLLIKGAKLLPSSD